MSRSPRAAGPVERPRARAAELRGAAGFLRGLGPFLAGRSEPAGAAARLERSLAERERSFADVLERAVFGRPASPYRRLLEWAGVERGDVFASLAADGVDATLARLWEAGVRVGLEEFKGRRPIARNGLELATTAADFDNPLTSRAWAAQTGGSGGEPRPLLVDLDLLEHESDYHARFFAAAGATERPVAIWHLAPPGAVGLKSALIQARLGRPVARWFAQNRLRDGAAKHALFARAAWLAARWHGAPIPAPEHVPAAAATRVAAWLAGQAGRGTPAVLLTTPSAGVRACAAALDAGLDVAGSLLVLVGEPFTAAKAAVVARAGCTAASHYAMTEAGLLGLACPHAGRAGGAPDAVHLAAGKIATVARPRPAGEDGAEALFHTSLLACSPKILINVESGDAAVRVERDCGCGALPAGFRAGLHTIRSYEKLTSEGMHFLGADLLGLLEELLPARFGGRPTDYQLAEHEREGLPGVRLVVRRELGALDERRVVDAALDYLRARGHGQRLMAEVWAQGDTLRIERGDPHVTAGGKIPALRALPR